IPTHPPARRHNFFKRCLVLLIRGNRDCQSGVWTIHLSPKPIGRGGNINKGAHFWITSGSVIPPIRQRSLGAKRKSEGCHAGVKRRLASLFETLRRRRSKATAWQASSLPAIASL